MSSSDELPSLPDDKKRQLPDKDLQDREIRVTVIDQERLKTRRVTEPRDRETEDRGVMTMTRRQDRERESTWPTSELEGHSHCLKLSYRRGILKLHEW